MKKLFVLFTIMFVLGSQASFSQTLSCQEAQKKISQDKMQQLYWVEKLGQAILSNEMFYPSKVDSVMLGKKLITASHYIFFKDSEIKTEFTIIIYNEEYTLLIDGKEEFNLHARFLAYGEKMQDYNSYLPIKKTYLRLVEKESYEPSSQELEEICKKISY